MNKFTTRSVWGSWMLHSSLMPVRAGLCVVMMLALAGCGGGDAGGDGAAAGTGGRSAQPESGSVFDTSDVDNTIAWWTNQLRPLGEAQRSGNQIRIEEATAEFDAVRNGLIGQRVSYTMSVRTPSVGGALATAQAISRDGVYVGVQRETDRGGLWVGTDRDARGANHVDSTPILLRPGEHFDEALLSQLSMQSTFVVSGDIFRTDWRGANFMRAPILILFVNNVQVEQVNP